MTYETISITFLNNFNDIWKQYPELLLAVLKSYINLNIINLHNINWKKNKYNKFQKKKNKIIRPLLALNSWGTTKIASCLTDNI